MAIIQNLQAGLLNQSSAQVIDGSLKFDGDADPGLRKTVGSGNRKTFTISVWVKHDSFDNNDRIFATYTDGGNYSGLYFMEMNQIIKLHMLRD